MIFLDTETCGFHGPIVLIQWAEDDGEIVLHDVWSSTITETTSLIEKIVEHQGGICGFNLAFDWFHICQLYTTLILLLEKEGDVYPEDYINRYAQLEKEARDGPCLKPISACDLMLWARKGHYQSTMDRKDIKIRKVPTKLAWELAQELEKRIQLKDIYFAKRKDRFAPKWKVFDRKETTDLKDVVLKFSASSALKILATDALNLEPETTLLFADVELDDPPIELAYAPFALAVAPNYEETHNWKGSWPEVIKRHIEHWGHNTLARTYAEKDVWLTREMWKFFNRPKPGDDDSELACLSGAARWKGYAIDIEGLKDLRNKARDKRKVVPTAPANVFRYLAEVISEDEQAIVLHNQEGRKCTKKVILENISKWVNHPAAQRAKDVLEARESKYDEDTYNKLLRAGRFHVAMSVIGARSGRMSGGAKADKGRTRSKGKGSINPQGIKKQDIVRKNFPLAFPGMTLCGGDFAGFEVVLMDAVYDDPKLRQALLTGKKIHALFGVHVYPDMTYEQIVKSSGTADDKYTRAKSAVFAMAYGGEAFTLANRLGVDIEIAEKAYQAFMREYSEMGRKRRKYADMFQPMKQPNPGGPVIWNEPSDYIESMFGFRRYFTLENQICKALYDLANDPPLAWKALKFKIKRRDDRGFQTVGGATQSALFGAAFAIQAANMRAAGNHVIQSSGAQLTKFLQRRIWDLQPSGIHQWYVQPMNIHDEIMCPANPEYTNKIKDVVDTFVKEYTSKVPLLKIDWSNKIDSWADK